MRATIENRTPLPKTGSLTMLRYQQMPMLPKAPSNASQRKIVTECLGLPKTPARASGPTEHNQASARKRAGETLSAGHAERIKKQVLELFKQGPLTVDMVACRLKLSVRESASRKVLDWAKRGLIAEVGSRPTGSVNGQRAKWWGLTK